MSVRPRRVVFALFPGCEVMDVTGPLQAFHEAAAFGVPYVIVHAAATPTVRTAQGLEFAGLVPFPDVGPDDRVIVPGYTLADTRPSAALVAWVRRAAAVGAQVCSVCTGAFVLGEAGLLDGRRCTTHWKRVRELQRRFPRATVVGDRLFVVDGPVTSSAGIASGVDMALALLERDGGPVLASSVAREMVVYMRRDGSHAQESVYLDYQTHLSPGVHVVQQHLVAHPESTERLGQLARMAGMSERTLTRAFRLATGISVGAYRERLRLERARDLMRNPTMTIDAIASACGYADARQLRRLWAARRGNNPRGRRV
ncbi:MAG: GlxA family transcriptional regulator [Gemmatimonadaceae bacterium]